MRKFVFALSAMMLASAAQSAVPVYSTPGVEIVSVSRTYDDYTASSSGMVYAYFLGKEAGYISKISLKVNGVVTAESPIFPNNATPLGASAALGWVNAGDSVELLLNILSPLSVAGDLSSNRDNNPDGKIHIYATPYAGGDYGIPLGNYLYIGFEDIRGDRDANYVNDWDYDDHRFAFEIRSAVPEPVTWAMMVAGFGLVGTSLRRRQIRSVHA